jgi:predicted esterase
MTLSAAGLLTKGRPVLRFHIPFLRNHTMQEKHIETTISGRYLVKAPAGDGPFPIIAGFHGFGQTAEDQMELMRQIPGSEHWLCCSVEALHPFINVKGDPGSCWMTRRDRDLRISENVSYVDAVLDDVKQYYAVSDTIVLHGFSQGAGMACRVAMLGKCSVAGVMLLGGDIPPELDVLGRMVKVHLGRGDSDRFYPQTQFEADTARLQDAGVPVEVTLYHGGHSPNDKYFSFAGRFLQSIV